MTYTRHFSKTIHVPVKVEYKASEFVLDRKGEIERDYKGNFNPHCSHPSCNSLISNIQIF